MDEQATNVPKVTAWADGYGVWHVRVPRHCVSPVVAARRALRDELTAREGEHLAREVWMHPVRVPELDTEDTVVYAEGEADTTTEQATYRYVVSYDQDPDYSYLNQTDDDGAPLFGDLTADDLVSYAVEQQRRCDCCGSWSTVDAVGGFDVEDGGEDDRGAYTTETLRDLPDFMAVHFAEVNA